MKRIASIAALALVVVTMRTGLVRSLNVVTVDVALQTGLARIANLATRFGLPKPERYPALALGTEEVTPLQLAAAYAAFVNDGHRVAAKAITNVGEPPSAHTLPLETDQVVSPTTAFMITNMLAGVIDQDAVHGLTRRPKQVGPIGCLFQDIAAQQPHHHFVDQRRGRQSMPVPLSPQTAFSLGV